MKIPLKQFINDNIRDGFLMICGGLPGTGKSAAAEKVRKIRGGALLKSDIIRREVLKGQDIFDAKVAGDAGKKNQVYDEMLRQADELLGTEENVILDATFNKEFLRQKAGEIAAKHGKTFYILETACPEAAALKRITGRNRATSVSNAVTPEAYFNVKKDYEPVRAGGGAKYIRVETGGKEPVVTDYKS